MLPGFTLPLVMGDEAQSLYDMIVARGYDTSLNVCLDAAVLAGYDGTSQTWTDLSGNGNHFYRGTTSGSDTTDPTFNGTAGAGTSAEYFSNDGVDLFQETTAQTYAETWHANNAAATIVGIVWPFGSGANNSVDIFSSKTTGATSEGVKLRAEDTNSALRLYISNGTTNQVNAVANSTVTLNAWNMVGCTIDEAATTYKVYGNGTLTALSTSATLSGSGAHSVANQLFVGSNANTSRFAAFFAASRVWTETELDNLYADIKAARPGYSLP
jgi:hypothetical protein